MDKIFDFATNKSVESLDAVPTDFHDLYVQKEEGEGYQIDDSNPGVKAAVALVGRMGGALKRARADVKAAKSGKVDLSPLADFGDSPAAILETFQSQLKDASKGKGGDDAEITRRIEKVKAEQSRVHKAEIEKREQREKFLYNEVLSGIKKGNRAIVAEAKALDPGLLLPLIADQTRVVEEDGKFFQQVVDKNGETRYSGTTGEPMKVKELVAEMKTIDRLKPLFESESRKGGGTPPGGGRRRVGGKDTEDMTPNQKIAAGLEKRGH